jgi:hypothetical protein
MPAVRSISQGNDQNGRQAQTGVWSDAAAIDRRSNRLLPDIDPVIAPSAHARLGGGC